MTKRVRAKHKIDRRLQENIWGRSKSPLNKRNSRPGQHGERRAGKLSDFGQQLKAKQKLKGYYASLTERQFHRLYVEAARLKGSTSEHLIGLLERRLDAVVYRAKFVPTVFAARQFVSHGHVSVNGRRVTIPSYRVKIGDTVSITLLPSVSTIFNPPGTKILAMLLVRPEAVMSACEFHTPSVLYP
jgi:small subunit ribosomal protein S4